MKKFIYVSDLKFGPDATKKQTFLFKADLEFAISEGYEYIQPKDGPVLKIISNNELVEVEVTEEELQAQAKANPTQVEFDPNEEDSPIFKSNHSLNDDYESFMTDVKICFNNGIKIIEDVDGFGYKIASPECVKAVYGPDGTNADAEDIESSLDEGVICINCESMALIDQHINRILKQEVISEGDASVMLKLTELSEVLGGH